MALCAVPESNLPTVQVLHVCVITGISGLDSILNIFPEEEVGEYYLWLSFQGTVVVCDVGHVCRLCYHE